MFIHLFTTLLLLLVTPSTSTPLTRDFFPDEEPPLIPTPFICAYLSDDNCMGFSFLDSEGPFPGQSLQLKSLNGSYAANDTKFLQRIWWRTTNLSQLYIIRDEDLNGTQRRLFLSDRWPQGGQQGRVKEAFLTKKRPVASVVEPLGLDKWGRVKLNDSEWCLTVTRCIRNDMGACMRDPAIRVKNESQIEKGSYLKWTQCLNETHPSQWFYPLPPTPSPTESPTLSPVTEAPTFPDETRAPTLEPTTAEPTSIPTSSESKEYEPNEYERVNKTLNPVQSPSAAPTETPTAEPSLSPTAQPTVPPTPQVTDDNDYITYAEFLPWKSKLP